MSEHVILAKNRTLNLSNITKIRTVREYRTVCSTSNFSTFFHCRKCLISNRVYIGMITTIALRTTKSALKAFNGIVTLAESNCCVYLGWNSRWPYKNESLLGKLLGQENTRSRTCLVVCVIQKRSSQNCPPTLPAAK